MINEIIKRVHSLSIDQQKDILSYLKVISDNEERQYVRKKMQLDIDAAAGDKILQGRTTDISAGGVYVTVSSHLKRGETARVVFQIPGQNLPFKIKGDLVRIDSSGIAIEFTGLSPYTQKTLDDAIWNDTL